MKGYWLILGTEITDQAAQNDYNRLWAPIAEKYQARLNPTKVQAGAAICFRDQRGEIAGVIERLHEFGGIGHLAIQPAPILAGKLGAELAHFVANILKIVSFGGHCRAYCD